MAQRTRNHILEDKSRSAFNEIIPETWVIRDKNKDYGIDCEVEIFDNLGNPSGLVFYVQLKATESKSPSKVKKVIFEFEKIYQFQSYNLPVIIVRYSHLENKLYYTWANDITSHVKNEKSITVNFTEDRILNNNNVEDIHDYLIRYNRAITGSFRLPINTFIKSSNSSTPVAIQQYFKKILLDKKEYFNLVRNENESILQLKIGKSKTYLVVP